MAICIHLSPADIETTRIGKEGRRWDAPAALRLWHVASLDAPTVALVWSCAFAWAGGVRLPAWSSIVLALIVWAVYIGDRLLDARAGMQSPPRHLLRERHHFHWRYRWLMGLAAAAAAAAAAGLVFTRLPAGARAPDSVVAATTLAYFSRVHSRGLTGRFLERILSPFSSRAFWIGILFTAGCMLPAASQIPPGLCTSHLRLLALPALFFAALAWLNCSAISQWESGRSTATGTKVIRNAGLVAAAGVLVVLALASCAARAAGVVAAGAVSALLFVLLERIRPRLTPVALRAAADLLLLTPVFLLALFP